MSFSSALGSFNVTSTTQVVSSQPNAGTTIGDLTINTDLVANAPQLISVDNTVVYSQGSAAVRHSTLFENFRLVVKPVYNFFTEDELIARPLDETLSLSELPRYIAISWNPTPQLEIIPLGTKAASSTVQTTLTPTVTAVKDSLANGFISPGAISAKLELASTSVTSTSFDEDQFLNDPLAAGLAAVQVWSPSTNLSVSQKIGITFVDPSIAGALDSDRILTTDSTLQLQVAASLTKLLGNFEVISEFNQDGLQTISVPTIQAGTDAPTLIYIGYIIERYVHDQNGSMALDATFDINDSKASSMIDRSVAYNATYSYRIRTIVQWTRPYTVGFELNGQQNQESATSIKNGMVSSYVAGDWSDWVTVKVADLVIPDPPDELTITPRSHVGTIRVSWKMPNDPQRDIKRLHLIRATIDDDGTMTSWQTIGSFVPANGHYDDTAAKTFDRDRTRYVYAMYSTTVHDETSPLSEQIACGLLTRFQGIERPVEQISFRGVPVGTYGFGSRIPERIEVDELVARANLKALARSADGTRRLTERTYILLIRSLQTGEMLPVTVRMVATEFRQRSIVRGA